VSGVMTKAGMSRRSARRQATSAALACALLAGGVLAQQLPVMRLTAGVHLIRAEVANNFETRGKGLMFRESLEPNQGMLFVFEDAATHCMWMRNTLIPLSVAFVDADGSIVNIADMKPRDETTHCAQRPVPYALEMDRGWFASRGIKPGQKIGGLDKAPPPK
jgi:uncharacterized membrane protein (UPF0127 family)